MIEKFTYGVHLVRVTTDEREYQLWAAATPREQAVRLVLNAGRILATRLAPDEVAFLNMACEVREL